jgi:glycosyltransferase involved in cell wall biosynthesis
MRILALEPYYGGSHKAFLDGWATRSAHEWDVIGLPAYKWKWRMRHAAITMAEVAATRIEKGARWDALFCSDMLNLAEFLGLAPTVVRALPTVVYFHENQLTYPDASATDRDYHFAFTNLTTALAAHGVWFNSAYHRDSFLSAMSEFLPRMPDYQPISAIDEIREKSQVQPPGIDEISPRENRRPGPLRILWAARWEHDKDPVTFFAAIESLKSSGVDFRLNVLGESFENVPEVFEQARQRFASHIDHWGFQPTREAYINVLRETDVVVSTAIHEFFGIAVAEAVSAGAIPLVPRALAYPELLDLAANSDAATFFHDGSARNVADKLAEWSAAIQSAQHVDKAQTTPRRAVSRFDWTTRATELDAALTQATA